MKHIHRFFISSPLTTGETAVLDKEDYFHASRVLRLEPGDEIEIAESHGRVFRARITRVDGLVEALAESEAGDARPVLLTVAQAIPKGRKMDLVVEKLSELGVTKLVPLYTAKSAVKPGKAGSERLDRWRRIAKAAAAQSKRRDIMQVTEPRGLGEWLDEAGRPLIALVTETDAEPLGAVTPGTQSNDKSASATLVTGPEAGFSDDELTWLHDAGAVFAGLGPLILRTETAAMVASTIILHRLGEIG